MTNHMDDVLCRMTCRTGASTAIAGFDLKKAVEVTCGVFTKFPAHREFQRTNTRKGWMTAGVTNVCNIMIEVDRLVSAAVGKPMHPNDADDRRPTLARPIVWIRTSILRLHWSMPSTRKEWWA